eukprot:scaffold12857_cov135-Isochrysis_galbana.AAC.2
MFAVGWASIDYGAIDRQIAKQLRFSTSLARVCAPTKARVIWFFCRAPPAVCGAVVGALRVLALVPAYMGYLAQ